MALIIKHSGPCLTTLDFCADETKDTVALIIKHSGTCLTTLEMSVLMKQKMFAPNHLCLYKTAVSLSKETEMVASLEDGQTATSDVIPLVVEARNKM